MIFCREFFVQLIKAFASDGFKSGRTSFSFLVAYLLTFLFKRSGMYSFKAIKGGEGSGRKSGWERAAYSKNNF